jgi:hypothetical protein
VAKLRPLKLLDDELEPFDLTVAMLNDSCHIAHKMLQKSRTEADCRSVRKAKREGFST